MVSEKRESAQLNFICIKGTSFQRSFNYKDSAGDPINLTGYTITFSIKSLDQNNTTILNLINGSGVTLTGASGLIELLITDAQTNLLEIGTYLYSLRITSPTGLISELTRGDFEVII